jgi:hypothetical protein
MEVNLDFSVPDIQVHDFIHIVVTILAELSSKIKKAVGTLALPTVDRLGIQNDVFALSKAGLITLPEALEVAEAYKNEVDFTVWSDLAASLSEVSTVWSTEPNIDELKVFIRRIFTPIATKLGYS